MSKLEKPTKPLGVGRGYSFSSVSSAKPTSKVGIKSDNNTTTGATVDDAKIVRKKSVKALEVDTLKRRKLALSRDQVKVARVSPVSRNDVKKRESISPEKKHGQKSCSEWYNIKKFQGCSKYCIEDKSNQQTKLRK